MNYPDRNTLWLFWRGNKTAFHVLFKRSVKGEVNAGLVGLAVQAVDGTKSQEQKLDVAMDTEIAAAEQNNR